MLFASCNARSSRLIGTSSARCATGQVDSDRPAESPGKRNDLSSRTGSRPRRWKKPPPAWNS
ncbi:hypothetical protein M8494_06495 [Serratia ureilytica]